MISEMLHIGNEFNDLPISDRKTQFGCNAIPERQDMADEVTRSNGRNGVAYYIETKILQYRRILYSCILRDLALYQKTVVKSYITKLLQNIRQVKHLATVSYSSFL